MQAFAMKWIVMYAVEYSNVKKIVSLFKRFTNNLI